MLSLNPFKSVRICSPSSHTPRCFSRASTHAWPERDSYLEFVVALVECRHLVVAVSPHQLAEGADELLVGDTVHVDLLVLVLQAHQAPQVGVGEGLDEPVPGEGLLVGVRGLQALLAVGHLAGDARLHRVLRRLLLAELALHALAGRRHGGAVGGGGGALAPRLARGVGPAQRRLLVAVDNVLKGDVPFESL